MVLGSVVGSQNGPKSGTSILPFWHETVPLKATNGHGRLFMEQIRFLPEACVAGHACICFYPAGELLQALERIKNTFFGVPVHPASSAARRTRSAERLRS